MFPKYNHIFSISLLLSLFILHSTSFVSSHVYIVYLGRNRLTDAPSTFKYHIRLLSGVFSSEEDGKRAMLYSYKHSFSGFSAKLNASQAMALSKMEAVISVFKSRSLQLHTTRSWDFLGLPIPDPPLISNPLPPSHLAYGDNVVVAIFDSGVWPESESFNDRWMGPVPCNWKGKCVKAYRFNPTSTCNRKLIGARYYLKGFEAEHGALNESGNPEFPSPRDFLGHGTHTASIAVGAIVANASFKSTSLGKGIARGGAPRARLAVYKVCWGKEYVGKCTEADVMAAFDDALRDGVHVISASFGGRPPLAPFFKSSSGIGSFHAMQKGVSVVFSGGNDGPHPSLVQNVYPWSICVGASNTDRTFPTQILVNQISIMGESLIRRNIINAKLANAINYFKDGICERESIRKGGKSGAGKVVVCFSTVGPVSIETAQDAAKAMNASALIFGAPPTTYLPDLDDLFIPTVLIHIAQATQLTNFLTQLPRLPIVEIKVARSVIGKSVAPTVPYFSSRGPSSISPHILKPDISGPGVNILAAWAWETAPTVRPSEEYKTNKKEVKWNFQSGTSMSCPHISGLVALIKSLHPNWSPAAIKSALITTATKSDRSGNTIQAGGSMKASDPFDIGSGQVNPLKAINPGLIYDINPIDYIINLCNLGYTEQQIRKLLEPSPQTRVFCPPFQSTSNIANLNYPSITLANLHSKTTIKRTVHNVSPIKNAIYFLNVLPPHGVRVFVWPRILIFSWFRQHVSYYVTLTPLKESRGRYDFGEIEWSNGFHSVKSTLVVRVMTASE